MSDRTHDSLPPRIEQRLEAMLRITQRIKDNAAPPDVKPAPFITISREYGCEALQLAEPLAARLADVEQVSPDAWQIYSRKLVEEMAQKLDLPTHVIDALDRTARGGVEEFFETILSRTAPDIKILRQLVSTVRAVAVLGRAIIIGRGGAVLTAGLPGGLHVRLIAPEAWRLESLIGRFGWDKDKARQFLRQEEQHRQTFINKYLGQDVNSPLHYDLILNVARTGREEQLAAIVGIFRQRLAPR